MATISATNFVLKPQTATKATVEVKNLDITVKERLSYKEWPDNGMYGQLGNGVKNGNVVFSTIDRNTKKNLSFGIVAADTAGPFLIPSILVAVYPVFSDFTNIRRMKAERDPNNFDNINVSWTAWGNWGNLTGWTAEAQVIDLTNNVVLARKPVDVKKTGTVVLPSKSATDNVRVRIVAKGRYHDGVEKTMLSNQITLESTNNTFVKVAGTWRKGLKTFVKVNGVWKDNKGNVQTKVNGAWK